MIPSYYADRITRSNERQMRDKLFCPEFSNFIEAGRKLVPTYFRDYFHPAAGYGMEKPEISSRFLLLRHNHIASLIKLGYNKVIVRSRSFFAACCKIVFILGSGCELGDLRLPIR